MTTTNTLRDAVIAQLGGDESEARDTLRDVAFHGADVGFAGFTYTRDTCQFFADNRADILALVRETASDFGEPPMELLKGFRCLADASEDEIGRVLYGTPDDDDTTVPNGLAWFALEEVARMEHPNL
jgi:hypothetical protein